MLQILKKYIFLHAIVCILFFSNSGYLHAFMQDHSEKDGMIITEHTHDDGIREVHVEYGVDTPAQPHCQNTTIEGIIKINNQRLILSPESINTSVAYPFEYELCTLSIDAFQYNTYYPGPPTESFSHFLVGEIVLLI